jgi:hypothetical protein
VATCVSVTTSLKLSEIPLVSGAMVLDLTQGAQAVLVVVVLVGWSANA